jgi:hypothetical protein
MRLQSYETPVQEFGGLGAWFSKGKMSPTHGGLQRNLNPLRDYVGLFNTSAHSYYRACLAEQKISPRGPNL